MKDPMPVFIPFPDVVPSEEAKILLARIRSNQHFLSMRLDSENVTLALERVIQLALDVYKN